MSRIQDFQIRLFYEFMFLQVRKDEKCQKSILISSRLSSTEVEPVGFRRYSSPLQFSTLVELQPQKVVGGEKKSSFPTLVFLDFWHEVRQ